MSAKRSFPMRRLAIIAAAGLCLTGLSASAQAQSESEVRPGYWKYTAKIGFIPVSTQYKCLKKDEIDRFLFNPCTRHYKCTYPTKTVSDGKVALKGVWVDKRGREAPVTASGTYTDTSVKLNAHVRTINGIPLSGVMEGTWQAASCPAGS